MTRENLLFSIIGVLLGVILGYVFATSVKQQPAPARRAAPANSAAGAITPGAELPEDHPPIPENAGLDQGGTPGADAALIQKAEAEPSNFEAQVEAARVHYRNRRFDEAISFLTRANQLRPDDRDTVVFLGNSNFDAGHYEAAEKWYTAALVKDARDVNVRTDLGLSFLLRQPPEVDRAIKEFRRSLEISPDHEQTLQNLAVALTKKGSFDEAEGTIKRLSEVNPANQSLAKLRADVEAGRASSKQSSAGKR